MTRRKNLATSLGKRDPRSSAAVPELPPKPDMTQLLGAPPPGWTGERRQRLEVRCMSPAEEAVFMAEREERRQQEDEAAARQRPRRGGRYPDAGAEGGDDRTDPPRRGAARATPGRAGTTDEPRRTTSRAREDGPAGPRVRPVPGRISRRGVIGGSAAD